jgi:hypothetical protein
MSTNYAAQSNAEALEAKIALQKADDVDPDPLGTAWLAEAQVHATLAVAYATLAVYTASGG